MNIKEVKKVYEGEYVEIEVYAFNNGSYSFHTDSLGEAVEDYTDDMELVADWSCELMDEEDYNHTILANGSVTADFDDWYENKDAKVLVIAVKRQVFKNTQIDYLYRDASNYKNINQQIVSGTLTDEQVEEIMVSCNEGEYFIPRQVGLPEERFEKINEDDHCWFEMLHIFKVDAEPTIELTATEVYQNFLKASGNWDDKPCLEHV